jgi:hypothetical protein
MSAEATLNALRVANAARQRVFYAKHKVRVLADKREGYRLVKAQRAPPARDPEPDYQQYEDAADNEYNHDDVRHDYPDEMPLAPRARAHRRIPYNEAAATAAIKAINSNYPHEKPRKDSSILGYVNGIKRLFTDLAPCPDLWARLCKPKAVVKKLQARIDAGDAALSSTTTLFVLIMVLFDHLPDFNLSDELKNEYRQITDLYRARNAANNLRLKASEEYRIIPWPLYLEKIDAAYPEGSIERLIAKMYHEVPVRDDFKELRIVEKASEMRDPSMNYLILPRTTASIVLNSYKTESKFRGLKLPPYKLSPKLATMLRAYIDNHKLAYGQFLFPKLAKNGLSTIVGKMNKKVGVKKLAINALRSMTIATEGDANKNLPENEREQKRINLATRMLHNSITSSVYMRGFQQ